MAARVAGTWTIVELTGRGMLRLGAQPRLFLEELRGLGRFTGEFHAGPLRFPVRVSFSLESSGPYLFLRPRRGMALLRVLSPLISRGGSAVMRDGMARIDLAAATGGRITLAPPAEFTPRPPPGNGLV